MACVWTKLLWTHGHLSVAAAAHRRYPPPHQLTALAQKIGVTASKPIVARVRNLHVMKWTSHMQNAGQTGALLVGSATAQLRRQHHRRVKFRCPVQSSVAARGEQCQQDAILWVHKSVIPAIWRCQTAWQCRVCGHARAVKPTAKQ